MAIWLPPPSHAQIYHFLRCGFQKFKIIKGSLVSFYNFCKYNIVFGLFGRHSEVLVHILLLTLPRSDSPTFQLHLYFAGTSNLQMLPIPFEQLSSADIIEKSKHLLNYFRMSLSIHWLFHKKCCIIQLLEFLHKNRDPSAIRCMQAKWTRLLFTNKKSRSPPDSDFPFK